VRAPEPGAEIDGFRLGERLHTGTMAWIYRLLGPDGPLPLIMKIPRLGPGEPAINVISFEQCRMVLGALAQGRLVALGDGTAEIAHDALLQAWPRLRGWLEEDQSSLILYGQLTKDTARWRQAGKDSSRLYRGVQLAAAREAAHVWAADPGRYPALPAAEAEFLRASGRAGTRRRVGRRSLAGALVLLLLAVLAGAGLAVRSARDDAGRQRTAATSARLAGQSTTLQATDPVTASLLAGAAWRIAPTAQARYSLLESLAQPVRGILSARSGEVTAVASSPGGKTLAAAYRDGTIRLWDTASHRLVSTATWGGATDALAFAGNGKTLEVAGPTAVGTWNLAGRATIARQPLAGVTGITGGRSAVFSPDGRKLATGSGEGNVRLWDVATRQEIGAPMSSGLASVETVAFSPDGATVAAGSSDGTVQLWDAATQNEVGTTLRPTRSDAIHWTANRMKNMACARKPSATHQLN